MRYFKSKILLFIIIILVLLVCIGLSFNPSSNLNIVGNVISVPFTSVESLFTYTGQKISEGVGLFDNVDTLKQKNKELQATIDKLNNEQVDYERIKKENEDLKSVLQMKDQFSQYEFIGADIIGKDVGTWFNVFLTNKGSTNGIDHNMPVITSKGLVGKVSVAQLFSSKITSIIDDGSAVSAIVSKSSDIVIVKGDAKLGKEGLCKLEYFSSDLDLAQGDYIETSGMGGIYPKGIIIGRIKEVRVGQSDIDKYAIVQPAVDFKKLNQIVILKNKNSAKDSQEMDITDK